jgi:hypothetical protein
VSPILVSMIFNLLDREIVSYKFISRSFFLINYSELPWENLNSQDSTIDQNSFHKCISFFTFNFFDKNHKRQFKFPLHFFLQIFIVLI